MIGFSYGSMSGAGYGGEHGSQYGTPLPRQAENVAAEQGGEADQLDISWDAAGSADEYAVLLAETTGTDAADYDEAAVTTDTSETLTGLEHGREYFVRVVARNARGDGPLSDEATETTALPPTEISAIDDTTLRELTLTLAPQDNSDRGSIEIYRSTDGTLGALLSDGLAPDTESYTDSDSVLDGTEYQYTVRRVTPDAQTDADALATSFLPDEDQPVLGNGVKDEIHIDREEAVSNNGDIRYQLRRSQDDPEWENADSFKQFIGSFDTVEFEFVGLLDGEEYDVRGRTETEDVTGEFTDPVSIITKFPGFDDFRIDSVSDSEVTLKWEDFADNEDGTRVERRAFINGSYRPWDLLDTLPETEGEGETVTYDDASVNSGTEYQYRIEPFTQFTSVQSDGITANTDGDRSEGASASGWKVEVINTESGRLITPDPLDSPAYNPGPNGRPEIEIPVRKRDEWFSEEYEDSDVRVWKDGRRLPIESLRDVEQSEDEVVLKAVGGVELEHRVQEEFTDERRHIAAEKILSENTSYVVDAPEPDTETLSGVVQQEPSTEAEFLDIISVESGSLFEFSDGGMVGRQISYTREGGDTDTESGDVTSSSGDEYSDGSARAIQNTGDEMSWEFTPDHDIPKEHFDVVVRDDDGEAGDLGGEGSVAFTWYIDGQQLTTLESVGPNLVLGWTDLKSGYDTTEPDDAPFDLSAGETYTISVECDDGGDLGNAYAVDVIAPIDERSKSDLNFDNEVSEPGGYLDGPGFFTRQELVFDNAPSAFNVVSGSADIDVDDTSGAQRVQISNDNGSTWLPSDGSENNTESISVDYTDAGSGSRIRVRLDGYSPDGVRNQTPRENYASQKLTSYVLRADITQELLLIDENFDASVESVLNDIADTADRIWSVIYREGSITIRFVEEDQFVSEFKPDITSRNATKESKTYDKVVIKGSHEPVSSEVYNADTSFTTLVRQNIKTGSEVVYDADTGENFERDDDYIIRYRSGEIRATDGGELEEGESYRIDYEYRSVGEFERPDAGDDPETLVEVIPGVTSSRLAEQIAFVIAGNLSDPRYSSQVFIPDPDPRFDPVESLPSDAFNLPESAGVLSISDDPVITPLGLQTTYGSRTSLQTQLNRLSRQVSRVSDRS